MKKVCLTPLALLFVVACTSTTTNVKHKVESVPNFIDFKPAKDKVYSPILVASESIYNNGNLCKFLIDNNVRAIRLHNVIGQTNYAINSIREFRQSSEYVEWNSELLSPRNENYLNFARQKIERLKQNLKEEIVRNSTPSFTTYVEMYVKENNVSIVLNGDQLLDYDSFCPEIFSPERYVINRMNGEL